MSGHAKFMDISRTFPPRFFSYIYTYIYCLLERAVTRLAAHEQYSEWNELKWRRRLRSRILHDNDYFAPFS